MLPPPIKSFASRDDLKKYFQDFAFIQGYVLTTARCEKDKYLILSCDMAGNFRNRYKLNETSRKKDKGTIKCGCQFSLYCFFKNNEWSFKVKKATHNHEKTDLKGHPKYRSFNDENIKHVQTLALANVAPRNILSSLRMENPDISVIQKDVYNLKSRIRRNNLAGRTPIRALLDNLKESKWTYNVDTNSNGEITEIAMETIFCQSHINSIS